MQNANGSVQVVVPVATGVSFTGKAEYDQNPAGGVGVGFQYNKDGLKIDVMADLKKIGMQYAQDPSAPPSPVSLQGESLGRQKLRHVRPPRQHQPRPPPATTPARRHQRHRRRLADNHHRPHRETQTRQQLPLGEPS